MKWWMKYGYIKDSDIETLDQYQDEDEFEEALKKSCNWEKLCLSRTKISFSYCCAILRGEEEV